MKTAIKGLTLTKIKSSDFASHETNCFEAVLCFKGVEVASAWNAGHGGCDTYYPMEKSSAQWKALMKECDKQAKVIAKGPDAGSWVTGNFVLECAVNELLLQYLMAKDLIKMLGSKVIYQTLDGKLHETRRAPNAKTRQSWAEQIKACPETKLVLNLLSKAEALAVYETYAVVAEGN